MKSLNSILALQSKLLQLLQDGQFCRIGAQEDKKVEVRVVCATNRKLEEEIENGTFRADLFLPHQRGESSHAAAARARLRSSPAWSTISSNTTIANTIAGPSRFPSELMDSLRKYHWPGNIRELENLIKRYVILGTEDVITSDLCPRETDFFNSDIPLDGPISLKKLTRQAVRELERKIILKVLQTHHWNRKQAARALSISYRALLYKIRDAGLPSNRSTRRREAPVGAGVAAD